MNLPKRFEDLPEEVQGQLRAAMAQLALLAHSYANYFVVGEMVGENPTWNIASCVAVQVGERAFLLTAAHVYRRYLERRDHDPSVGAQAGRLMIPLAEREIYVNDAVDIAAFSLAELDLRLLGRELHLVNRLAPTVAPKEGDYVQFAGFPAYYRHDPGPRETSLAGLAGFVEVVGAEEHRIYCHVDRDYMLEFGPEPMPPHDVVLGGLSGGPVLMRGALHYPVIGLVSEFLPGLQVFKCAVCPPELDAALRDA